MSVIAITNTSYVDLLTCVWVFCFLKVQKYNLSPTLALNYTKATRRRIGLVSCPFYLSQPWFYVWYVVGLIHVYFTIKESLLLIQAEVKKWKSNYLFFKSTFLWKKIFISRYVNSGWLTLFVRLEVTRRDSFDFRMLLIIFDLQGQSF